MAYRNLPLSPEDMLHSTRLISSSTAAVTETSTDIVTKSQIKARNFLMAFKQRLNHHHTIYSAPPEPYSLAALGIKKETREEEDIYLNDANLINSIITKDYNAINLRTHPLTCFPERLQNVRVTQKLFFALRARVDAFFSDLKLLPLREATEEKYMLLDAIACIKFYEGCWVVIVGWEYSKKWMDAAHFLAGGMRAELELAIISLTDGLRERKEVLREERENIAMCARRVGDEARLALKLREMKG